MKRILALTLALCMLLALCACSGTPKTDKPTEAEAPKTEAPATEAPKTEAPATEAPETEAPETEAPETEAPETEAPETEAPAAAIFHGTVEGDTYVNESLNLKITRPQGWIFFTDEQIAAQNNLTVEALEGTDISEALAKNGQMMDMFMQRADNSNANLIIQPSQPLMAGYSDEQLFQLMEETYRAQLAGTGMELTSYEIQSYQIFGEDKNVLRLGVTVMGTEMVEYQIWLRDLPEYYGILTLTLTDGSDPAEFFAGLSHLNSN